MEITTTQKVICTILHNANSNPKVTNIYVGNFGVFIIYNMNKYLLSILIAITVFVNNVSSQNVKGYYKSVFRAEKYLIENNYKKAVRFYKRAFRTGLEFQSDLSNAFKSALLAENKRSVGFFWKAIKISPVLVEKLTHSPEVLNHKFNTVAEDMKQYKKTEPLQGYLERITDSILKVDQQARHICGNNLKKECIEIFKKTDSINIYFLENLLIKGNYQKIDLTDKALFNINVIALHSRRFGYTNLDSLFLEYIHLGYIKPIWYAHLNLYRSDFTELNTKLTSIPRLGIGDYYMFINDTVIEFKRNDSSISILNGRRKPLFIEDVELEIKLAKFAYSNPLFKNSKKDFCIEYMSWQMSEAEKKEMITGFKERKLLVE